MTSDSLTKEGENEAAEERDGAKLQHKPAEASLSVVADPETGSQMGIAWVSKAQPDLAFFGNKESTLPAKSPRGEGLFELDFGYGAYGPRSPHAATRASTPESTYSAASLSSRLWSSCLLSSRLRTRPLLQRQLGEKSAGESCESCETSKPQPEVLAMVQATLEDTMKGKQTTVTPKAPYPRPRHDTVFCKHCKDFPGGFRGLHGLNRRLLV
jgi:hypothetical protein